MDDIKLALLGNKEAAKRLTDAGGDSILRKRLEALNDGKGD